MTAQPENDGFWSDTKIERECQIKGKRIPYDACSSKDLDYAKRYYGTSQYIGSGTIYWINGVKNEFDELHHFFKSKP